MSFVFGAVVVVVSLILIDSWVLRALLYAVATAAWYGVPVLVREVRAGRKSDRDDRADW